MSAGCSPPLDIATTNVPNFESASSIELTDPSQEHLRTGRRAPAAAAPGPPTAEEALPRRRIFLHAHPHDRAAGQLPGLQVNVLRGGTIVK